MQSFRADQSGLAQIKRNLFEKILLPARQAQEDILHKNHGAGLSAFFDPSDMIGTLGGFAEVLVPVSHYPLDDPVAILCIGNISVKLFKQTFPGLLASILKVVQSC